MWYKRIINSFFGIRKKNDLEKIIIEANTIIDEDTMPVLDELNLSELETLYINDIESGPYIADTLRADSTTNEIEALVVINTIL